MPGVSQLRCSGSLDAMAGMTIVAATMWVDISRIRVPTAVSAYDVAPTAASTRRRVVLWGMRGPSREERPGGTVAVL